MVASAVARGLRVLSEVESGGIVSGDSDSSEARKAEVLLREIGGLEIASMTGAMLQGAEVRPALNLQCCFQNKYQIMYNKNNNSRGDLTDLFTVTVTSVNRDFVLAVLLFRCHPEIYLCSL